MGCLIIFTSVKRESTMQILFQNSELSPNVLLEGWIAQTHPWLWRLQCVDIGKEKGFRSKFTTDRLLLMPFTPFICETVSYHKTNH